MRLGLPLALHEDRTYISHLPVYQGRTERERGDQCATYRDGDGHAYESG
jgi:hypothetical protein